MRRGFSFSKYGLRWRRKPSIIQTHVFFTVKEERAHDALITFLLSIGLIDMQGFHCKFVGVLFLSRDILPILEITFG